jgi:hypothetical protein
LPDFVMLADLRTEARHWFRDGNSRGTSRYFAKLAVYFALARKLFVGGQNTSTLHIPATRRILADTKPLANEWSLSKEFARLGLTTEGAEPGPPEYTHALFVIVSNISRYYPNRLDRINWMFTVLSSRDVT